ncbi:hypothetical protein ES703_85270 [subsurface metagenome]
MVKTQKGPNQMIPVSNGTAMKAVTTLFMWAVMYSFLFLIIALAPFYQSLPLG